MLWQISVKCEEYAKMFRQLFKVFENCLLNIKPINESSNIFRAFFTHQEHASKTLIEREKPHTSY